MTERFYLEKPANFSPAAAALKREAQEFLGIPGLAEVRILDRYDVAGGGGPDWRRAAERALAGPAETVHADLPAGADYSFAVEYLPGQYDQNADVAEQTLVAGTGNADLQVRRARVYQLFGDLTEVEATSLRDYVLNPVDARAVDPAGDLPPLPEATTPPPTPTVEAVLTADKTGLAALREELGLALDQDDFLFIQDYFQGEGRAPTIAELRALDTYWSDHCRHTTFLTELTGVTFADPRAEATYQEYLRIRADLGRTKPVNLMDVATIAVKHLRAAGKLDRLDESAEVNACTVHIDVDVDGETEPWLLLFKNETHNHPTEIEPFGGAATCIGGAIRDPLSGRAYVYQAMRIGGAPDPRVPAANTRPGKLPARKIIREAAAGHSSYANQIGLPAGLVTEVFHPGFEAKRMELGAVVGAVPAKQVRREEPQPGDKVILLGGPTGRDGLGGATSSSRTQTAQSVTEASAEVQKGNPLEERKLQKLFRRPEAARLIKRSNDFGAGGVSVAIGELADGLHIDLDAVPVKYPGLSGTELAISESQERMAVVVDAADVEAFRALAAEEDVPAAVVAEVTAEPRLVMTHRGETVIDLRRSFLDSAGAAKTATASVRPPAAVPAGSAVGEPAADLHGRLVELAANLNVASQRGVVEGFDQTSGGRAVFLPLGGERQLTPTQVMAALVPVPAGETETASVMAAGFNPEILAADPYRGGYLAVVESLAKLVAAGAGLDEVYLSLQEFFPRLGTDPERWGEPLAALLGALQAELDFEVAAIGGKDSMSGTFEDLEVPPTLVSFAVTTAPGGQLLSPEFKRAGSRLALLRPVADLNGLPDPESLREIWAAGAAAVRSEEALSAWTPVGGGLAEGLIKMAAGNRFGAKVDGSVPLWDHLYGAVLLETVPGGTTGETIGAVSSDYTLQWGDAEADLEEVEKAWTGAWEEIFPTALAPAEAPVTPPEVTYPGAAASKAPALRTAKPRFVLPIFPGTTGEDDAARAFLRAGAKVDTVLLRTQNLAEREASAREFAERLRGAEGLFFPGGAAGGDEPGGPAKLAAALLNVGGAEEAIAELVAERGGLIGGVGNGFQVLLRLGLLPGGTYPEPAPSGPHVRENLLGGHRSRIVRTRVTSTLSPWLAEVEVGQVLSSVFSGAWGRLTAAEGTWEQLAAAGQIAAQYVDEQGQPSLDLDANPGGSEWAVEALSSADGRVFGKMGHVERGGKNLLRNVPGDYDWGLFTAAVKYFA